MYSSSLWINLLENVGLIDKLKINLMVAKKMPKKHDLKNGNNT